MSIVGRLPGCFLPLLLTLAFFAAAAPRLADVGLTTDELLHQEHARRLWSYYASLGEDLQVLELRNLRFYGGLFDLAGITVAKIVGSDDQLAIRHLLCLLCAATALYCASRTAEQFAGPHAAILTAVLLATHPRWFGNALFNAKDIPFAAGYAAALYLLIRLVRDLPKAGLWRWLQFGAATGCAMSIRIGGIIFLVLATIPCLTALRGSIERRDAIHPIVGWLLATTTAFGIALCFWPFLAQSPFTHLLEVVKMSSNFEWHGRQLYFGVAATTQEIGRAYLPVWFWITTPLSLLLGWVLLVGLSGRRSSHFAQVRAGMAVLTIAALAPLLVALALRSVIYDGVRHFLFAFPALAVLASLGWIATWRALDAHTRLRPIVALVLTLTIIEPTTWIVRSHPYEYAYFAPQSGGFARSSANFATDYWFLSSRAAARALDQIAASLPPDQTLSVRAQNLFLIKPQLAPRTADRLELTALRMNRPADLEVLFFDRLIRREIDLSGSFLVVSTLVPDQVPFFVVRDLRTQVAGATSRIGEP